MQILSYYEQLRRAAGSDEQLARAFAEAEVPLSTSQRARGGSDLSLRTAERCRAMSSSDPAPRSAAGSITPRLGAVAVAVPKDGGKPRVLIRDNPAKAEEDALIALNTASIPPFTSPPSTGCLMAKAQLSAA